jgi:hypothetical protein
MAERYEAPSVRDLGSVKELTAQDLDKVGSLDDFLTPTIPSLDGEILPDP